ncbi:MAG: DUF2169 domain-containing protein [Paracoccus sp. (in: a-proteobacteria)]|nr:DUF2169 domain-containing protein [Paracoccus sp. (in: a-proteobacteria)]
MWQLVNRTPFEATGTFARDAAGAEFWCSAVVAEFVPRDQRVCILVPKVQTRLVPEFSGAEADVLAHDADLAPFRPQTDVIVLGDAIAADGRPAAELPVALSLGKLSRQLRVTAPARLVRGFWGWQREEGDPVARVATGWEMALGGRDPFAEEDDGDGICPDNPPGKGWSRNLGRAARGDMIELSQIRHAAADDEADPLQLLAGPAGMGFVHPAWGGRARFAGSYDEEWRAATAPLLPADFDSRFYQAAPSAQVYPGDVLGGEPVTLTGMREEGPWSFRLPQIVMAQDCRIAGRTETTRMRLVSVQIDAGAGRLRMVWNAATRCTGRDHRLERTVLRLVQMNGVGA